MLFMEKTNNILIKIFIYGYSIHVNDQSTIYIFTQ